MKIGELQTLSNISLDQTHSNLPFYQKLVVPEKLRPEVLKDNHAEVQAGHLGPEKTYSRISE